MRARHVLAIVLSLVVYLLLHPYVWKAYVHPHGGGPVRFSVPDNGAGSSGANPLGGAAEVGGTSDGSWPEGADPNDPASCAKQLPNSRAPQFSNPAVARGLTVLCSPTILVGYFGPTRTGLWSAEYLTPERVRAARSVARVNSFHPDSRVSDGPELSDYVRSGYDRGHLSPSGDQPTPATQNDSFTLANMAPQNPGLNRGPWERLEEAVRNKAQEEPLYVITGVRFVGANIGFLHDRVGIPSTYYKLVYDPTDRSAVVYEAPNVQGGEPQPYSVEQFQQMAGVDFGLGDVSEMTLSVSGGRRYH